MLINNQDVIIRVGLVAFLADTLAAHQLGGFKIGVGWAFRKCRHCLATKQHVQTKVYMYTHTVYIHVHVLYYLNL